MSSLLWLVLPVLGAALLLFLRWVAYLIFCAWIVRVTGNSRALRDVAVAARAFPDARDLALLRRPGGRPVLQRAVGEDVSIHRAGKQP